MPDIGYLHSGFEKLGEDLDFNQYVTVVDRMNYISPFANECAWFHTVEKLLDIEITPRCKYLRTILSELARISDHLLCIGAAALDLGALTAFLYAFNQREKVYDIMEFAAGQAVPPKLLSRRRADGRHLRRRGRQDSRLREDLPAGPTPTSRAC